MSSQLPVSLSAAIDAEIEKLLRETETSTVSLGSNLHKIVAEAEGLVAEIQAQVGSLGSGADGSVAAVLAEQTHTVSDFIASIEDSVETQQGLVAQISETSDVVSGAANSVASISLQSRMLSLNTMIEANRLGAQGLPFMVIAKEMRELSENIAVSNQRISALTRDLMPLVALIRETLKALGLQARDFRSSIEGQRVRIDQVTQHLETLIRSIESVGDQRLATIVERSNASLVDLQMQDILSQRLRRIQSQVVAQLQANNPGVAPGLMQPNALNQSKVGSVDQFAALVPTAEDLGSGEMTLF
jgi:methyl-accepting chemotaxis protein